MSALDTFRVKHEAAAVRESFVREFLPSVTAEPVCEKLEEFVTLMCVEVWRFESGAISTPSTVISSVTKGVCL